MTPLNYSPHPVVNRVNGSSPAAEPTGSSHASTVAEETLDLTASHVGLGSFFTCDGNTLAYRACRSLADRGKLLASPLYLYGPSGMGKTHLLAGLHRDLRRSVGADHVVALNGAEFAARFASSVYSQRLPTFRKVFRQAQALILDDVHLLQGKTKTQQELLYTLDELRDLARPVVLSSCYSPATIPAMCEKLVQRFQGGLVVAIRPLDGPSRLNLMTLALGGRLRVLGSGVPEFLSRNLRGSVAELLAVVRRLSVTASLAGRPVDLDMARDELMEFLCLDRTVTLDCISRVTSAAFGVEVDDLRGRSRRRHLTHPRQLAMYLARELTPHSLQEIGRHFGGVSHTTVRLARRKVELDIETDPELRDTMERLLGVLRDGRSS